MATLTQPLRTRFDAILAGTYPSGTPYIPAGTFTARQIALPQGNPAFPAGAQSAAINRAFDRQWPEGRFEGNPIENGSQGPWIRSVRFILRVQYAVQLPKAHAPLPTELSLGALDVATARAQDDAAVIEWALLRPGAWDGVAIGLTELAATTVAQADRLRALATISGRFSVEMSAATRPEIASLT